MNAADTNEVLNYLSVLHSRSLASYLHYALPFDDQENAREVLELIVADHHRTVDRIGELIIENKGDINPGEYPMYFTGYNDLAFSYLIDVLIKHQTKHIAEVEKCVEQLAMAPLAREFAEEALGEARGHLQSLQELAAEAKA